MIWGRFLVVGYVVYCCGISQAADVQAVWGTAYDSNLYEVATGAQGGLVSRFFMTADSQLLHWNQVVIKLQQQAGIKRFWSKASGQAEPGDVFVYQLDMQGQRRYGSRVFLLLGGNFKYKQATRAPGEESYLRGGGQVHLQVKLSPVVQMGGLLRLGADDSRDVILPEIRYREFNTEFKYLHNRYLNGRFYFSHQRISYNRPALIEDKNASAIHYVPAFYQQQDRLQIFGVEMQAYPGMFLQAAYAYMNQSSNSFGYGYRAHRLQGMAIRHIGWGIDGQFFGQFQLRQYKDVLPALSGRISEADEYEQTLGIAKISKELNARYGVSVQYSFYRNGARQGDSYYRKHVFGVAWDIKL